MSLRNIHLQVRDAGGVIEAAGRSMQDLLDFGRASEAVATAFLPEVEVANFKQWLQSALSPVNPGAARAEYDALQLNVSRAPLRLVFAPRNRLTSDR
jgi:hypothetical protein